jgi:hypothetical protein
MVLLRSEVEGNYLLVSDRCDRLLYSTDFTAVDQLVMLR